MHTYQITFRDGKRARINAEHIVEACAQLMPHPELVTKIECIDRAIVRHDVSEANSRLHSYGTDYHDSYQVMPYIREILATNGFDVTLLDDVEIKGEQGARRSVDVGRGVYLSMTWFRMGTGRYEINAYLT